MLEHTKIPPHSLVVGVPAQVKAQLTDDHVARIKTTLEHYVERGQLYRAEGRGDVTIRDS